MRGFNDERHSDSDGVLGGRPRSEIVACEGCEQVYKVRFTESFADRDKPDYCHCPYCGFKRFGEIGFDLWPSGVPRSERKVSG